MSRKWLIACLFSTLLIVRFFHIFMEIFWISDVHSVKELKHVEEKITRSNNLHPFQTSLHLSHLNHEQLGEIGRIVQRRLEYLQNPVFCRSRRKLHCQLHLCGFGCTINTIVTCLMIAYATNRTTVVSPALTSVLKPLSSTCMTVDTGNRRTYGKGHEKFQVVYYFHKNKYKQEYHPPALPDDLFEIIKRYHDNPFLWWTGQFSKYVVRPRESTMDQLFSMGVFSEFKRPIVGVHIRRTDKNQEGRSRYHSVDKYMFHVEKWFERRPNSTRRIYLATDEPKAVVEVKQKYPQYIVINDFNITTNTGVKNDDRLSERARFEIFHDVYFLSKCDFIVCTFSSNVCRLVFQLMNAEQGNISRQTVMSLDRDWHFQKTSKKRHLHGFGTKMPHYKFPLESKSMFKNPSR